MDYFSYHAYSVDLTLSESLLLYLDLRRPWNSLSYTLLKNLQVGDCLAFKWSLRLWIEFPKEYKEELEVNPNVF